MEKEPKEAQILPPELTARASNALPLVPRVVAEAGDGAAKRFLEFFTVTIRNPNTRAAYAAACGQFLAWAEARCLALEDVEAVHVAAYIEHHPGSPATVKQHLAALRMMFDWLVTGHVLKRNPAAPVRGPKYVVKKGKTPVLAADDVRALFGAIDTGTLIGLRDRAFLGVMIYSFARVGAVCGMRVSDYYQNGKRWWLRLHEKGGKFHEVPAHHTAEEYLDAYLEAAGIAGDSGGALFRTVAGRSGRLTAEAFDRRSALYMVKRRAAAVGLTGRICNHSFRATGITVYRKNGGSLEKAAAIAAHESMSTTKLYDRSGDDISLDEVERIAF